MTSATLIHVDFKARKVIEQKELENPPGADLALNKRLINDMKAMLDEVASQVDLSSLIVMIPNEEMDLICKIDGTDLAPVDLQGMGRIYRKLRERHVER